MPQPKRRKQDDEDVEPQDNGGNGDDQDAEEQLEDEGPQGTNIDIGEDRVVIELPRDDNTGKTLTAIGELLDKLGV